jgi:hypothetical protein
VIIRLIPLPLLFLLSGCVVTQTVYLNQIDVEGPIASVPITPRIDPDPPTVQLTPRIAFSTSSEMTGTYTGSSTNVSPRGDGDLTWKFPAAEFGLDMLIMGSEHFGANLGGSLSTVSGHSQGMFRLGFLYSSVNEGTGISLEAGLQWTSLRVRARTMVITEVVSVFGDGQYVDYFDDTQNSTGLGGYLGLTVNTIRTESTINLFVNGGVVWQQLLGYSAHTRDFILGPGDYHSTAPYLHESLVFLDLTPGITFELGSGNRILIGGRLVFPLDIDTSTKVLLQPVIQCSFAL